MRQGLVAEAARSLTGDGLGRGASASRLTSNLRHLGLCDGFLGKNLARISIISQNSREIFPHFQYRSEPFSTQLI